VGQSSTQMTHDMFKTFLNPGDDVVLFDPTYANYFGQLYFTVPDAKIEPSSAGVNIVVPTVETATIKALETNTWRYLPSPAEALKELVNIIETHDPKLLLFPSPDNPTSQIQPQKFVKALLDLCKEHGIYVAIDFAYKTQYFGDMPEYYSYSPKDYPNLIGLNSNSKWNRGLGRRLGWMTASKEVVQAMERTQQCSILCPDTIHQIVVSAFLKDSIADGGLGKYLEDARHAYKKAAEVTVKAIDEHLGMKRLVPQGGLYTVMDVGQPADEFVQDVMKNTNVLFVPGTGFGSTLQNAVRISYGPLVHNIEKINEGFERVGKYLKKK
jgi:aminotransferase